MPIWPATRSGPRSATALLVNLLTEDNLPYYFRTVEQIFGKDGAWGTWVRRWTAEEGRHSMAIYGYLMTTRAIDPVELERSRMAQVSGGQTPNPPLHECFIYLALQELATRISHRNTGALLGDPAGYEVMKRVGSDENLHQLFYRDLAAAAIEADPNTMMIAMEKQVRNFAMPGTGIPDFDRHAALIAKAGIYDLQVHHEQILVPVVLRQWDAANVGGLSGDGAIAQEKLMKRLATSEKVARRFAEARRRPRLRLTTSAMSRTRTYGAFAHRSSRWPRWASTARTRRCAAVSCSSPSFVKTFEMCFSTAPSDTTSRSAMPLFDNPSAISARTSSSRGVSRSNSEVRAVRPISWRTTSASTALPPTATRRTEATKSSTSTTRSFNR